MERLIVADIGASGGIHPRWRSIPHIGILVEPDPREIENLKSKLPPETTLIETALSDRKERRAFHLYRKQECSSFYEPDLEHVRRYPDSERLEVVRTIEMDADTLENQLSSRNVRDVDFIKVDTEGHELPILKGAGSLLDRVIGIETEIYFSRIRKGIPVFRELDAFLSAQGFELVDLNRAFWKQSPSLDSNRDRKGQLIMGEALYLRPAKDIVKRFRTEPEKIVRAARVYMAFHYLDLAQELLVEAERAAALPAARVAELRTWLETFERADLPWFRGRYRILLFSQWLSRLLERVRRKLSLVSFEDGSDPPVGNPS